MVFDSALMQAVEQRGYRVTVGDVAAQAGLKIALAQQGLMALAADVGADMQVAESGEIAYLFPENFRKILRDKDAKIRRQEFWAKIWAVLFYLIRISFGVFLILSIVLITIAISLIVIGGVISSSQNNENTRDDERNSGGSFSFSGWGFSPDFLWYLWPSRSNPAASHHPGQRINFLEAIFSFVFGDGNPNPDLAAQGWQQLGALIRQNHGAVIAEQMLPYLVSPPDSLSLSGTNENYVLPALVQFNGVPHVSDRGDIVYQFPDLQTTANSSTSEPTLEPALKEQLWQFSRASGTQVLWAIGLGCLNLGGALVLGELLATAPMDGFIGLIRSVFWLLLTYGSSFLGIPCLRYWLLLGRNQKIAERNSQRQQLANQFQNQLQEQPELARKLQFAHQFSQQTDFANQDLAYTTEQDWLQQEIAQKQQQDADWQRRLERGDPSS